MRSLRAQARAALATLALWAGVLFIAFPVAAALDFAGWLAGRRIEREAREREARIRSEADRAWGARTHEARR